MHLYDVFLSRLEKLSSIIIISGSFNNSEINLTLTRCPLDKFFSSIFLNVFLYLVFFLSEKIY